MKRAWTPTPIARLPSPAVRIAIPCPPSAYRLIDILWSLVRVFWFSRVPLGNALRAEFERLGGVWIKVGQLLSLRQDLFPADFCFALSTLQGQSVGFPPALARRDIEAQVGRPIADVFDVFVDDPIAAASVGQVHYARLRHEARWVAIKIRLPFAVENFTADLAILATLVRWAPLIAVCARTWPGHIIRFRLGEGVEELRRIVIEELDFRFEANAQRRMRKTLRAHGLLVPKTFPAYSTDRLLVSEWVPGVLMGDYLDLITMDAAAAATWARANGIRPTRVALLLLPSLLRQIFEDNRFHGDMHPRNIMLLRGGRVVLLDFGTTSSTERLFLATFRNQIAAMATGEYRWAAELTNLLSAPPPRSWWVTRMIRAIVSDHANRIDDLTNALIREMEAWAIRTEIASLNYYEKSINACTTKLTATVLAHGGAMTWAWMRIQRALSTLDGSLAKLYPTINYPRVVRDYLLDAASRVSALDPLLAVLDVVRRFPEFAQLLARAPEYWRLEMSRLRQLASPLQGI